MENMASKYRLVLSLLLILFLVRFVNAQDKEKNSGPAETTFTFVCTSTSDDSIQLKATIIVKHEDGARNLANASVNFFVTGPEGDTKLGQAKTDIRGVALFKVPAKNTFPRNESSLINFKAVFDGTDKYVSNEGEFAIKPSKLTVSFYEEDSLKYVKVEALQYNADGSTSPLGPVDLAVGVQKMFSVLKIADLSLDSTGVGTAEFPSGLIGDSLGFLKVIASMEDNETYGNVIGNASVKWGAPKHLISPDRPSRELWTPVAPLWMIITLIIMLAGVWGHYIYAVVQLVLIKKSAVKSTKKESEEEVTV